MKKSRLTILIISLLIINLFFISIIYAATSKTPPSPPSNPSGEPEGTPNPDVPGGEVDPNTGLPKNTQFVTDIGDKLSDENSRDEFLKTEYQKLLNQSGVLRPIYNVYSMISPVTNPVLKFLTGIKPAISYLFFLALVLWIFFAIYIFRLSKSMKSKAMHYVVSLTAIIILSYFAIIGKIANFIISVISKASPWVMQVILVLAVIGALLLGAAFSTKISKIASGENKKSTKEQDELKLKTDLEMLEDFRKIFVKGK